MVKISAETVKEAAKNVNELLESASPELKMLMENPNFATGLCLVLHREVQQLKKQLQQGGPSQGQAGQPAMPGRGSNNDSPQPEFAQQRQAQPQSAAGPQTPMHQGADPEAEAMPEPHTSQGNPSAFAEQSPAPFPKQRQTALKQEQPRSEERESEALFV